MKTVSKIFLVLLALSIVQGCVSIQTRLTKDHKPDEKSAYVYGNFSLIQRSSGLGTGRLNLSIALTGTTATPAEYETYYIGFKDYPVVNENEDVQAIDNEDLQLVAVPPGKYDMNNVVNLVKDMVGYNPIGNSQLFKTKEPIFIELKPNTAHYLGDYLGRTTVHYEGQYTHYSWGILSIKNSMEKSSKKLSDDYPQFKNIEKENLVIGIEKQVRNKLDQPL